MPNKLQEAIDDVRKFITLHRVGQHERGSVVTAEDLGGEDHIPRLLELNAIAPHDPNAPAPVEPESTASSSPAPAEGQSATTQLPATTQQPPNP